MWPPVSLQRRQHAGRRRHVQNWAKSRPGSSRLRLRPKTTSSREDLASEARKGTLTRTRSPPRQLLGAHDQSLLRQLCLERVHVFLEELPLRFAFCLNPLHGLASHQNSGNRQRSYTKGSGTDSDG